MTKMRYRNLIKLGPVLHNISLVYVIAEYGLNVSWKLFFAEWATNLFFNFFIFLHSRVYWGHYSTM